MWFRVKVVTPASTPLWLSQNQTAATKAQRSPRSCRPGRQLGAGIPIRPLHRRGDELDDRADRATEAPRHGGTHVDHYEDDHGAHEHHEGPTGILKWLTTTDHKIIGLSYTITSVIMFVIGGAWPS